MKPETGWDQNGHPVAAEAWLESRLPSGTGGESRVCLKHGDAYWIGEASGDMRGPGQGLWIGSAPVICRWRLSLGAAQPVLLNSSISHDNVVHTANLTSRLLPAVGGGPELDEIIHIERKRLLCDGCFYEQMTFSNFSRRTIELPASIEFIATPDCQSSAVLRDAETAVGFDCTAADGAERRIWIQFSEKPHTLSRQRATFMLNVASGSSQVLYAEIGPALSLPSRARFRAAAAHAHFSTRALRRRGTGLRSNARTFNEWMEKARADLALLTNRLPTGPFPLSEIPPNGHLGTFPTIVAGLQTLWLDPALARGILRALSSETLSRPGVPRDMVPLYVVLAGAYAERTGDLYLIDELWPSLDRAINWIEDEGDQDKDGLIDEGDELDPSPFALAGLTQSGRCARVELQAYSYRAFTAMSTMAERRHQFDAAARFQRAAERLRANVEAAFWMPDRNFYARAIDSSGQLCSVRSTGAGHLLFAGLPSAARGRLVIEQLLAGDFNTGWGLRNVAQGEAGYNPMSWHSGSIWAHDMAICAAGMARYGERDGTVRLIGQMFDAAVKFDMRMPQLFCGFKRGAGEGPVAYPQMTQPQVWAAGSPFMMLQACVGLRIDGYRGALHINRPRLPPDVDQLILRGLLVGSRQIDLTYHRAGNGVVAYSDDFFDGSIPVLQHA